MSYKETDKQLPQIARELDVDAIVEGSIMRAGDRIRINAQLIVAETDHHVWAESYERDLKDVLSLQNDLARAIVREIEVALSPPEEVRLTRIDAVHPKAHEAYLKGLHIWRTHPSPSIETSLQYFEEALKADPDYAKAYAGIAEVYINAAHGYLPLHEAFPKAIDAASKALELDDSLPDALTASADAKYHYEYDWAGAESDFQRVFELSPGYALAHTWYSGLLVARGRFGETTTEIERALRLDPLYDIG